MSKISAAFTVYGGTARYMDLDVEGKTPDEIAEMVDSEFDGVSLCHQCSPDCEDPFVELTSFMVGDVEYVLADGKWVKSEARPLDLNKAKAELREELERDPRV